jgi:hypothetical protein
VKDKSKCPFCLKMIAVVRPRQATPFLRLHRRGKQPHERYVSPRVQCEGSLLAFKE